jgi:hypothetical protein
MNHVHTFKNIFFGLLAACVIPSSAMERQRIVCYNPHLGVSLYGDILHVAVFEGGYEKKRSLMIPLAHQNLLLKNKTDLLGRPFIDFHRDNQKILLLFDSVINPQKCLADFKKRVLQLAPKKKSTGECKQQIAQKQPESHSALIEVVRRLCPDFKYADKFRIDIKRMIDVQHDSERLKSNEFLSVQVAQLYKYMVAAMQRSPDYYWKETPFLVITLRRYVGNTLPTFRYSLIAIPLLLDCKERDALYSEFLFPGKLDAVSSFDYNELKREEAKDWDVDFSLRYEGRTIDHVVRLPRIHVVNSEVDFFAIDQGEEKQNHIVTQENFASALSEKLNEYKKTILLERLI